jgi:hypothetical protein
VWRKILSRSNWNTRSLVMLNACLQDADLEVVARGAGDCWVSACVDGLRSLTVVLEGRGEGGLQVHVIFVG